MEEKENALLNFKKTVSRDFRPSVFSLNVTPWGKDVHFYAHHDYILQRKKI
jgi:hypothetical protein